MYLKHNKNTWVFDIETDSLQPMVIWCLCAINVATGEERVFTDYDGMRSFIDSVLAEPDGQLAGHNVIAFDAPVCNRLLGTRIGVLRLLDTLVLSQLYSPSLTGGHSLDAWGQRLKFPKTHFDDWSLLSDDMVQYCLNDCHVNLRVYLALSSRMASVGFSERSCEIEHRAWANIKKQQRNGFQLDVPKAHELYAELRQLERDLKDEIYKQWPPELQEVRHYKRSTRKDGDYTAGFKRHREQFPKIEIESDGSYRAFDYVEFNLGSPKQRVEKLLELGWKPREFTPINPKTGGGGNPQATRKGHLVPSLEEFLDEKLDSDEGSAVRLLVEWIAINARGNTVGNWIDLADEKGLIHGNLWLAGTLRYRHDKPNTANIPAVRTRETVDSETGEKTVEILKGRRGVFTYEARDLWTVRDPSSRSLVGVDAKGAQLRILAQYLNDSNFTEAILSEDPHEANRQLLGLPTRSLCKTITYATLMGAGDSKIASEAKISIKEAKEAKQIFFDRLPGLPRLIKRLKSELQRSSRITLCSGARILVPSDHMVIPYLLQGDESCLMKQAWIYANEEISKRKLDILKVADVHDEWQSDCLTEHSEEFAYEVCPAGFDKSGKSFNYLVPIECDAKIGKTWAQCH